jgi:hypothetical protein
MNGLLPEERVLQLIHFIRDQKVMLDRYVRGAN